MGARSLTTVESHRAFEGEVRRYRHRSDTLDCDMGFACFLPPQALAGQKVPVLYWLSGLTCDDTNFITKAGAQRKLAERGIMVVCPDTSPRGCNLPGEDDSYDFGSGAGFYLTATTEHYRDHYKMDTYVTQELPQLVAEIQPHNTNQVGILGHSMGGLGALNLFLKNRNQYHSVSAFAPICNPTNCPWGRRAFEGYLGPDEAAWEAYDPVCLLRQTNLDDLPPILVSQGTADPFLEEHLHDWALPKHANIDVRREPGYDHSYYFISTFIDQHIDHHWRILQAGAANP
ncbi:uncharacterized protein MONBRDRAFT_15139 [Monosiga brevicollis MX1]|uniref:S-formylglutathione hydrolase n=1 Tax=Monosiga brevicollis TaxID=81824 RepID=A9USY8_MONBE|nr:uncharacterized protein MONBRDRAFT_15139 [Monosiga brevicollis MX1]EDQ91404.1 predicted protein [Monosiga brevicollis MX1]|eukprot:XP_001743826.1 hypothetical protein [Monosiga brevicollis MX1]